MPHATARILDSGSVFVTALSRLVVNLFTLPSLLTALPSALVSLPWHFMVAITANNLSKALALPTLVLPLPLLLPQLELLPSTELLEELLDLDLAQAPHTRLVIYTHL